MKRVAIGLAIFGLVAIAAYLVFVVVEAVSEGEQYGSVFWSAVVLLLVIAVGALWIAKRLYAIFSAKPS
jgi:hypothetical protein